MKAKILDKFFSNCTRCKKRFCVLEIIKEGQKTKQLISKYGLKCLVRRCGECYNHKKSCKLYWTNCEWCDARFYGKTPNVARCCSNSCKWRLLDKETGYVTRKQEELKKRIPIECVTCGVEFITCRKDWNTCSDRCKEVKNRKRRNTYMRKKREEEKLSRPPKHCLTCSKVITDPRAKYCSSECRIPKKNKFCQVCDVEIRVGKYCTSHKPVYKPVSYTKDCPTCGVSFECRNASKIYCRPKCSPTRKARKRLERRSSKCVEKPSWVTWKDVSDFEKTKPGEGYELDHIVPLNHPDVCGLHCPDNFQWLTREENGLKSNKFDGTNENNSWKK